MPQQRRWTLWAPERPRVSASMAALVARAERTEHGECGRGEGVELHDEGRGRDAEAGEGRCEGQQRARPRPLVGVGVGYGGDARLDGDGVRGDGKGVLLRGVHRGGEGGEGARGEAGGGRGKGKADAQARKRTALAR